MAFFEIVGDIAEVRDERGEIRRAELHWYEAHGVGRQGMKIKRFLDWCDG